MNDSIDKHFDKILLTLLFLVILLVWQYHHLPWVENIAGQVLAALLTLMVGNRAFARKPETNGGSSETTSTANGTPPAPAISVPSGMREAGNPSPQPTINP